MKNIRKISALLVALAVMASFCVPALAVPTTQVVDDIVFYNSFENYNAGVGTHNASLAAGANGWFLWSGSRSYVTYSKLNDEVVTNIDIAKDEKTYETFAYTLKNGDAFTGKIALETKLMPTADEEFEIRILNRNLTAEGGTTYNAGDAIGTNHMIYGVLNFTNGKFRYTNVKNTPKAEGGYGDVTTASETIPAAVNEWLTLRYEIDTDSETYSVYANGTELFKDAPMFIKEKAEADRTFAQSVTNIGYMTFRKAKDHPLYLYVDDVAVYDLASTTKYYWGDATVREYNCNVGDVLYDAKIEIPLVDASGAATTKTVKTPVRLARLDSSKPGIQLTTADGLTGNVKLNINKEAVISQGDTMEQTDFAGWVTSTSNAKTETESGNNFLRVTANGSTAYTYVLNDKNRFASVDDLEVSFRIRFSGTMSDMTSANNAFQMQFINTASAEMPTFYFIPGNKELRYVKKTSGNIYGQTGSQKLITGVTMPGADANWHTYKLVYSNGTLKVYVDDKLATFNNHDTATGTGNGTVTESPLPSDFGLYRICFKFNNASQTTAIVDLDDFKVVKPAVSGNATLASIGEQEWTTAKGALTLPTQVKGTLSDGSDAYYDIISFTADDAEASDVGEYTYTANVVGYDSPVTVKVNVVDKAYDLSVESAAVDTANVTITSNVSHASPATLFVATFRNNKLLDVQKKAISATESYTSEIERECGDVVKAFVWNVNGVAPLALSAEATVAE